MINTIFYFPSSYAQYEADLQNSNINSRTIAFVPPTGNENTGTIYRNGIQYGKMTKEDLRKLLITVLEEHDDILPIADDDTLGAIKVGEGLDATSNGVLSVDFSGVDPADGINGLDALVQYIIRHLSSADREMLRGPQGPKGDKGDDGEDGTPGAKGDKGDDGNDGRGIVRITKTGTSGLVDTYTIVYTDGQQSLFTVTNGSTGGVGPQGPQGPKGDKGDNGTNGTNGRGISQILKTGANGLVDTYTITYTDNTTSVFTVTNGRNGQDGGTANVNTELEKVEFTDATSAGVQGTQLNLALNKDDGTQAEPDTWTVADITINSATTTKAGLMSASDKTKLNGIETGAQVHIAPTSAEVKSALGTGSGTTKYLREDGTWATPTTSASVSQVQSDWNQTDNSQVDYIKNKPTLATVATSGNYNDLSNKPDLSNVGAESISTIDINDTTGEGSSQAINNFGAKYYVTSLSTDEFAENTITIPDPTNNVGKSIDIYTYFKSENGKSNVPVNIVCNTNDVNIIRVDNGEIGDESFLKLDTGDSIHFRVLTATTILAYHYGTGAGSSKKTKKTDFYDIITSFNTVLTSLGESEIKDQGATADAYSYLNAMYSLADKEWDDENSDLFKQSTYPEIYTGTDYRGTNDKYTNLCYKAMQAWLMAMCLTELIPSESTQLEPLTNNQTSIFLHAYDLGGGAEVDLYGGYTLKGDPMIARLAAGAIYAKNHDDKASDIINARKALKGGDGSRPITGSDYSALGFDDTKYFWNSVTDSFTTNGFWVNGEESDTWAEGATSFDRAGYVVNKVGYVVNTGEFIPNTPGPRVAHSFAAKQENDLPSAQGQSESLFDSNNNYTVDTNIDDYVVAQYNCGSATPISTWNGYDSEKKQRLIQALATPPCTQMYMFGAEKYVSLDGIFSRTEPSIANNGFNTTTYNEYKFIESGQSSGLSIKGPFYMHTGLAKFVTFPSGMSGEQKPAYSRSQKNAAQLFVIDALDIADGVVRYPTYGPQYGRRRPGAADGLDASPGRSATPGDPLNELYNRFIAGMVADDSDQVANTATEDGLAADRPASYPSGHSAQIWTLAMLLGQMNPSSIATYMRNAYEYAVNRTIGRFHWNSDVMYGRLFGTFALPIINAMAGMQSGYSAAKTVVTNSIPNPTSGVTVNITNNSDSSITILKKLRFVLNNGTNTVSEVMMLGSDSSTPVTIASGSTQQFTNISLGDLGQYAGYNFATSALVTAYNTAAGRRYPSNIVVYDADNTTDTITMPMMSSSYTLLNDATYNITLGGSGVSNEAITVVVTNNSGSQITFENRIGFRLSDDPVNEVLLLDLGGQTTTLDDGQSATFSNISIIGKQGIGTSFASSSELQQETARLNQLYPSAGTWVIDSNISMYNSESKNNNGITVGAINPTSFSSSETFRGGATYNINVGSSASTVTGGGTPGQGGGSAEVIPGSNPSPNPTPGYVSEGTVNLNIVNNSSIDFGDTDSFAYDEITVDPSTLNALLKVYIQGSENPVSVILSAKENSSWSDVSNLENPACRTTSCGFDLANTNGSKSLSNVYWKVASSDVNDYIPSTGRSIINNTGGRYNTFYVQNGYYSTKDLGIRVSVTGESGMFKNGGTYTVTITNA